MRHVLLFGLILSSLLPGAASAQDLPSRAARVLALDAERVGVWLDPQHVWIPSSGTYLSACASGRGCAPIEPEPTGCEPPACPGHGVRLTVARPVAAVGGFPHDYGGYQRELEAMRADPALAPIAAHLSNHPEHAARSAALARQREAERREERRHEESVRWVSRYRDGDRWELALDGTIGTLGHEGGSYAGGTASFGLRMLADDDDSDETDEDSVVLGVFVGDTLGGDLRVHFLHRIDGGQTAEWITAVGLAPSFSNRFETSVVRLPSFLGVISPELGAIFRADRDATWYAAWDFPVSLLVSHDFAVDVTARIFVVDDWIELPADAPEDEDDPAEVILTLSVGGRLP